jgi:hypothetical protein
LGRIVLDGIGTRMVKDHKELKEFIETSLHSVQMKLYEEGIK